MNDQHEHDRLSDDGCPHDEPAGDLPFSEDRRRPLSPRERQVVDLVEQGCLNKEIAARLCLTYGTTKQYVGRVFRKLGVTNRTELAVWSVAHRQRIQA